MGFNMNDYSTASGERRLASDKLDSLIYRMRKSLDHLPPTIPADQREAVKVSLEAKKKMIDDLPQEVLALDGFLGVIDPRQLPESEDLLIRLCKLGKFADGLFSLPATPVNLNSLTQADVYDLHVPNLTNPRENFYLVAFVGFHKQASDILGVEPRTGITGPKWTEENKKFYRAESFECVYRRRERLLTSLRVLPFNAEIPENMDLIMDRLLKDDKFVGVKAALDKAVDRVFQRGYSGEDRSGYLMYFLTEVLFFASQAKAQTLSFHFGTDIETAWDLAYNYILVHEKRAFEELCESADIEPKQSTNFSGLNYQRPSVYPPSLGQKRVKPYDPDRSLAVWIPEIGDDETTIRGKLDNASEENLRTLASGLFYASCDVPDLRDVLRNSDLYKRLEHGLGNGVYPHRNRFMDKGDVSQMLAASSEFFRGVL